jgi:hypothetical protein
VVAGVGQYNPMSIPEHIWRFPTRKAIESLAKRFNLPNTPEMQDWEWEVADPDRIDEFISVYESGDLDDDEKFTLMETIIQSFEELENPLKKEPRWERVLRLIENNINLHIYTVWYWSDLENDNEDEQWRVNPFIKKILLKYMDKFAQQKH